MIQPANMAEQCGEVSQKVAQCVMQSRLEMQKNAPGLADTRGRMENNSLLLDGITQGTNAVVGGLDYFELI